MTNIRLHIAKLAITAFVALVDTPSVGEFIRRRRDAVKPLATEFTLSFSGDLLQHMTQLTSARRGDGTFDFTRTFVHIDTLWRSVDYAVVNYETTISADGKYTGYPVFASPPDVAYQMAQSGIKIAALANNHIFDKGYKGLARTIDVLDSIGVMTVGAYKNADDARHMTILTKDRFRVALLNYTYSTNGMATPRRAIVCRIDSAAMAADIRRAREDSAATHVVAFVHWGNEYQRKAHPTQRATAMWLRQNGVDAVVGSHPHVVQEIDTANCVVYSLGNFISNQQDRYTDSGLTVVVTLTFDAKAGIKYLPHWCDKFVTGNEKYRVLTERDTVLQRGEGLRKLKSALAEAREAVGRAEEIRL